MTTKGRGGFRYVSDVVDTLSRGRQARALTISCSAKARPAKALKAIQGSALAVAGLAAAQLPAQAMVRSN